MMKTKIILVLVFLLSIMPIYSKPISFRMKGAFQRGCPRMPSITKVEADYEGEDIAVNIQKYSGTVWICIYDVDGNLVSSIADTITKNGFITQNVANLPTGEYTAQGGLSVAGGCRYLTKDGNTSIEKEGYIPYPLQA